MYINFYYVIIMTMRQFFNNLVISIETKSIESVQTLLNGFIKFDIIQNPQQQQSSKQIQSKTKISLDLSKPQDRALQLAFRMNKLRLQKQKKKQQQLKQYRIFNESSRQPQKVMNSNHIVHKPNKNEVNVLKKSLKQNEHYHNKKFVKKIIDDIIDNLVERVEKHKYYLKELRTQKILHQKPYKSIDYSQSRYTNTDKPQFLLSKSMRYPSNQFRTRILKEEKDKKLMPIVQMRYMKQMLNKRKSYHQRTFNCNSRLSPKKNSQLLTFSANMHNNVYNINQCIYSIVIKDPQHHQIQQKDIAHSIIVVKEQKPEININNFLIQLQNHIKEEQEDFKKQDKQINETGVQEQEKQQNSEEKQQISQEQHSEKQQNDNEKEQLAQNPQSQIQQQLKESEFQQQQGNCFPVVNVYQKQSNDLFFIQSMERQ